MPPRLPAVRFSTLVLQDLRALPRHVFGMGALAVLLALEAAFGYAAAHGRDGVPIYLFFTWVAAPLLVGVVVAARVAAARRSRFVDSLFTTPLTQRTWLASQLAVGAILVLGVLVASSPFLLVHLGHVPPPPELAPMLVAGFGVGAFAVAMGVFAGVVVGDAGPGAASAIAGGAGLAAFLGFIAEGILGSGDAGAIHPALLRIAHLSPVALALDASGGSVVLGLAPAQGWGAALGLTVMVAGLLAAGWLAYTRQQGPLGWESQRGTGARWALVALVALALVTPVAAASVSYHAAGDHGRFLLEGDEKELVTVAARDAPLTDASLTLLSLFRQEPLAHGEDNARDVLVALRVPVNATVRDLHVRFEGGDAFVVQGGLDAAAPEPAGRAHETRGIGFPGEPQGEERNVYRIPVTVRPVQAHALLESRGTLHVRIDYVADGVPRQSDAALTLVSDIPGAAAQVLAAGALLPLACVGGLVARKVRTR